MSEDKSSLEIALEQTSALDVFQKDGVEILVSELEGEVRSIVHDVTTKKGRKEIASLAYKVSCSKTALDALGKDLVAEWKAKSKAVDSDRKKIRDRLDALRDEVRNPLTEWEAVEKAKVEKDKLEAEKAKAHESAIDENDLFDRQKAIKLKEEELRQAELKRIEEEEAAKAEKEQREREEILLRKAAEEAKEESQRKARQAKVDAEERLNQEREAKQKAQWKAEQEKVLAEERRIKDLEEQEERLKKEHKAKEAERLKKVADEREKAEIKAADKKNQRIINNEILASLQSIGISEEHSRLIITKVARNEIPKLKIIY